jgi:hypothetical protein
MTLKEKFRPHAKYWDCYNDEPLKYDHENKCVKIADEFAIGFADWVGQNTINYSSGKFRMKTLKPTLFTSKELLEIYKKENKL